MARLLYGATSGDYTMTAGGRVIPNAEIEIWDAIEGGSQITDLTDYDGNPCTVVTSGADGLVRFYGPDGENDNLWMDTRQGSRLLVRPTVLTASIGDGSILDEDIAADAHIDRSKIAGTALTADSTGVFNVKDYGAIGDGSTDDTTAIEACIAAAAAAGHGQVYFPPIAGVEYPAAYTGYKTTAPITLPAGVDLLMKSNILYFGSVGTTALTIGSEDTRNDDRFIVAKVGRRTLHAWSDAADIGIKIINLFTSHCEVSATGFTTGVQVAAKNSGSYYNRFVLRDIITNKYGLDLLSDTGGYVNENLFYGGHFSVYSDTNPAVSRYGIRIRSTHGYNANANIFHKPSFEIGNTHLAENGAEVVPILIEEGSMNAFYDVRGESGETYIVRTQGTSKNNLVTMTYGWSVADDQGTCPSTKVRGLYLQHSTVEHVVFSNPSVHHSAVATYNANPEYSLVNVRGMFGGDSSTGTRYNFVEATIESGYLKLATGSMIGVVLDVRRVKQFKCAAATEAGHGGRWKIRCYNAAGVLMDPLSGGVEISPRFIESSTDIYATPEAGHHYVLSSDMTNGSTVMFTVTDPDVASVDVMLGAAWVSAIQITTEDPMGLLCSATTPFPEGKDINLVVGGPPAVGTYAVGRQVYTATPAVGQPVGWVCTVAGTPGTWKAMANLA